MADLNHRPFSRDYSGLTNQSVVAGVIIVLAFSGQEIMKRRRRGKGPFKEGQLGSVESWEFGYLYQGRSWAKRPSPPSPKGWPLSWVKQVLTFPEDKFNELRGVDASFYVRFLRGCFWWALAHAFTTFLILFPIHVLFSGDAIESKSMTRASISSLVTTAKGRSLLWIHLILLFWVTFSWMFNVWWVCRGTFRHRAAHIQAVAARTADMSAAEKASQYASHPHPGIPFQALPVLDHEGWTNGLRLRTVIVTNLPSQLRSERELREYFQYYLSRKLEMPSVGLGTGTVTQPGLINKLFAFIYNIAKKQSKRVPHFLQRQSLSQTSGDEHGATEAGRAERTSLQVDTQRTRDTSQSEDVPQIDRVVVVRKMTELASLLERREDVLVRLETAHIKLAQKSLAAVQDVMKQRREDRFRLQSRTSQIFLRPLRKNTGPEIHIEELAGDAHGRTASDGGEIGGEDRTDLLVRTLGPFVEEFKLNGPISGPRPLLGKCTGEDNHRRAGSDDSEAEDSPTDEKFSGRTIWDALLSLPRSTLDAYQPLIHLNALFRGKTVPAIDYYTAKLNLLNSLILENRAKPAAQFEAVSTAFVTFQDPADARRACQYLAVHPNNPMNCFTAMAPSYEDLDWTRVMKSSYRSEFVKDWVVGLGVWTFTLFWLLPVSLLLTLVSVQKLQGYWPALSRYLDTHKWEEELIQSFLPTVLVAGLAILIPLILLLIAKKAHTIITLSELHDRIMTRYYKFLILNVLVFFCVGTATIQTFLTKFRDSIDGQNLITIIGQSFPSAGPFYVGWLIFTTAMHGGFEVALFGLPLLVYPATKGQITPRKRNVGIRPRTLNYYYWLPNHLLVIHVLLLFSLLMPLVLPFGVIYFAVARTVIKNQLLHVYAKNYEGNGKLLMIRMLRYSFDGLMLMQVVFVAYMAILKKYTNVSLASILIAVTALIKILATRYCRARFEEDDMAEATAHCGDGPPPGTENSRPTTPQVEAPDIVPGSNPTVVHPSFWTWRFPSKINFNYGTIPGRHHFANAKRQPIPFGPQAQSFRRLNSMELPKVTDVQPDPRAANSMPTFATDEKHSPQVIPPQLPREYGADGVLGDQTEDARSVKKTRVLVSQHPPHPAWDDESNPDHPYDNPYYTRDISNFLWLPRNPCGILDLDDTVDMHKALTQTPNIGQLGAWNENTSTAAAEEITGLSMISSMEWISEFGEDDDEPNEPNESGTHGRAEPPSSIPIPLPGEFLTIRPVPQTIVQSPEELPNPLTGTEEIDLPPIFAARAKTDHDVEESEITRKRSIISRRSTSRQRSISERHSPAPSVPPLPRPRLPSSTPPRRPSTMQSRTPQYRSFSGNSRYSARRLSASSSGGDAHRRSRSMSQAPHDLEFGHRPTLHSQASFTRSILSVVESAAARSHVSESGHGRSGSNYVTAQEAVVSEVIAEEREIVEERMMEEEQEMAAQTQKRSWWTAWAFTSSRPPGPPTPQAL